MLLHHTNNHCNNHDPSTCILETIFQSIETISTSKVQMLHSNSIFIIIGNFNIVIHATSQRNKELVNYMHSQHLQEITNKCTPKTKTQIDHIWMNLDYNDCEINILDAYWTGHDAIYALLSLN
jgi:hypothetical protein